MENNSSLRKNFRLYLLGGVLLFWCVAICGRLIYLQIFRYGSFVKQAEHQQQREIPLSAKRGIIYDRAGHELAMSVLVDSAFAVPSEVKDLPTAVSLITRITGEDHNVVLADCKAHKTFCWVARKADDETIERIRSLNLQGIHFQKEPKRFYPARDLAAQVVGTVGMEDAGQSGIEHEFDDELRGRAGKMLISVDARRQWFSDVEKQPEPGQNLVLTIDKNIQYIAEKELDQAIHETQAIAGTVIVENPHTGEILALANRPTFNPNSRRQITPAALNNRAVSYAYEPGSTFKLVTYSAALDQHVAAPDDKIDCQGGAITLAGRVIHDDKADHFGVITVHEALEHSSDVAAVKLALKMGPDKFYQYIRDFGFGTRSGAELPGETRGLLRAPNRWGSSSIGSIAIGQEVAVTPLQLVSMVSTIANGGIYLPPHVLMPGQVGASTQKPGAPQAQLAAVPFKPGEELPNPLPTGAHRVLSELTAAQMRKMMEGVVLFGTGKGAQLNGYSSGGKTGTAQKIDPATHLYSKTMHVASFAGIAPINNPVISVAVIIDNPKGASYYGAAVSAPVFTEVAQQVLEYLGVPHDIDVRAPKTPAKKEAMVAEDDAGQNTGDINALYAAANDLPSDDPLRGAPDAQAAAPPANPAPTTAPTPGKDTKANTTTPPANSQSPQQATQQANPAGQTTVMVNEARLLKVPSLIGLSIRKVIEQAAAAGLEVQITGNGTVREQAPAAGTMVPPGTQIVVRCGRN